MKDESMKCIECGKYTDELWAYKIYCQTVAYEWLCKTCFESKERAAE